VAPPGSSGSRSRQLKLRETVATALGRLHLIVGALETAAKRGVTVQVVMTRSTDWKTNFDALKAAGVQVHTYPDSSKALYIHAKIIDADHGRVFLGSENFSVGSMQYNRELGLTTTSAPILKSVQKTFASDFSGAAPW
jgi:cardiolipin synthase A/B